MIYELRYHAVLLEAVQYSVYISRGAFTRLMAKMLRAKYT